MSIFDKTGQRPSLTEGYRALELFTDRGQILLGVEKYEPELARVN